MNNIWSLCIYFFSSYTKLTEKKENKQQQPGNHGHYSRKNASCPVKNNSQQTVSTLSQMTKDPSIHS